MSGKPPKFPGTQAGHRTPRALAPLRIADKRRAPSAPDGLTEASIKRWRLYWRSGISRAVDPVADIHRVERWIRLVDEYETILPTFRKSRLIPGSQGQLVMNPLGTYLVNLEAQICRAETELGLTPMARIRLGIKIEETKLIAAQAREAARKENEREQDDLGPREMMRVLS